MRNLLVTISTVFLISLCYGSPIRNRQAYSSETLQKTISEAILSGRKVDQNETGYSNAREDKDKQNYLVLVVTVPETTTARPQEIVEAEPELSEPESTPLLINVNDDDAPTATVPKAEPVNETPVGPVQETRQAPSLINAIGNVLVHTIRGNFSGIVDESFGTGVSTPLVTVLNNLLSDPSCNTIRRLLGQCTTQGSATPAPAAEDTRALLLSVII